MYSQITWSNSGVFWEEFYTCDPKHRNTNRYLHYFTRSIMPASAADHDTPIIHTHSPIDCDASSDLWASLTIYPSSSLRRRQSFEKSPIGIKRQSDFRFRIYFIITSHFYNDRVGRVLMMFELLGFDWRGHGVHIVWADNPEQITRLFTNPIIFKSRLLADYIKLPWIILTK